MKTYHIYGKHNSMRTFKAMDLRNNTVTNNLIYASMLNEVEMNKFMSGDAKINLDWQFEAREI